jgi:hypothetical protein
VFGTLENYIINYATTSRIFLWGPCCSSSITANTFTGLDGYISNTVNGLSEAGTAYPSRAPEFTPGMLLIFLVFCVVLLCVFTF